MSVFTQTGGDGGGDKYWAFALRLAVTVLDSLRAKCWFLVGLLSEPGLAADNGDCGGAVAAEVAAAGIKWSVDSVPNKGGVKPSNDSMEHPAGPTEEMERPLTEEFG